MVVTEGYKKSLSGSTEVETSNHSDPIKAKPDLVNHPPHYNSRDIECPHCGKQLECIDIVENFPCIEANIIKYIWRYQYKDGLRDLKKVRWYIDRLISNIEKKIQVEDTPISGV